MPFFTIYQDQLFPTAELSLEEREKMDSFLKILEESSVGNIIYEETKKIKALVAETHIIHIDCLLVSSMLFQNIRAV